MDLHPEYGLTLLKDNYNAFQPDSFNKDECTKLRADKWKTCHPNNSDLEPCTADMTIEELHSLFKQHQSCYHYRAAENQSLCFDTPDPGHIKAERIELNHTEQCRILLDAKTITKEPNKHNVQKEKSQKKQKVKNVPIESAQKVQNVPTESVQNVQNVPIESVPKEKAIKVKIKKYKWWVYVLGIITIIGIGLFLFYVY